MTAKRSTVDVASRYSAELERARASGRPLLDLTERDPGRCRLAWEPPEAPRTDPDAAPPDPPGLQAARDAVAGYLAGRGVAVGPERIVVTASARAASACLFDLLCEPGDAVLVPSPNHPFLDALAARHSVQLTRYPLTYDGEWRLDRKALRRAVRSRTRAVVAASPATPTGAVLARDELAFLEDLCASKGLALVVDEALADTALASARSVLGASRCLAFHLAALSTVCGVPRLASWIAVAGPEPLAEAALQTLRAVSVAHPRASAAAQRAMPALLGRRAPFLAALGQRLSGNRARLATAALREAPWTPLASGGGWSAVLQIGAAWDEEAVSLRLLEDGVVVRPGFLDGLTRGSHLVVSLLPDPATFGDALERTERRLREPA